MEFREGSGFRVITDIFLTFIRVDLQVLNFSLSSSSGSIISKLFLEGDRGPSKILFNEF